MAKKAKEKELDMSVIENQKIVNVDLNSEMKKSYIDSLIHTTIKK